MTLYLIADCCFLIYFLKSTLGDLSTYEPSPAQLSSWLAVSGNLPWDPIASSAVLVEQPLVCPKCASSVKARKYLSRVRSGLTYRRGYAYIFLWVCSAYIGTHIEHPGYGENDFQFVCPACTFVITKDKLAVAKFARDIARDPINADHVAKYGHGVYLPYVFSIPQKNSSRPSHTHCLEERFSRLPKMLLLTKQC
jgi:hypothetical protein